MKILFIGGNGNISWYCVQKALEAGHEVWELNRGVTRATRRDVQNDVRQLICDKRDIKKVKSMLSGMKFDCVCDFICYNEVDAENAQVLFKDITQQYILISSEAVYQRKPLCLPFVEQSQQYDPSTVDSYIAGKIRAEQVLRQTCEKEDFPLTIIRPGYTYDTILPSALGQNCFTALQKVLDGDPMIVLGEGTNVWSPLHSEDFARAFIHFIGNPITIGQSYHITGEKYYQWNEIAEELLSLLGVPDRSIFHITAEQVEQIDFLAGRELTRQHMGHYIFDNSKMKTVASDWRQQILFAEGAARTLQWLYEKDVRRRYDKSFAAQIEKIYAMCAR